MKFKIFHRTSIESILSQGIPEMYSDPPWRVPPTIVQQAEVNQLLEQSMCAQVISCWTWNIDNIYFDNIITDFTIITSMQSKKFPDRQPLYQALTTFATLCFQTLGVLHFHTEIFGILNHLWMDSAPWWYKWVMGEFFIVSIVGDISVPTHSKYQIPIKLTPTQNFQPRSCLSPPPLPRGSRNQLQNSFWFVFLIFFQNKTVLVCSG